MAVKTVRTCTLKELKEKAGLASKIPVLVEIAKTAPNLTQARDKAYQHAVGQTRDLKDAKKLADSTRALAMLRRDFADEFEKLVAQEKQLKQQEKLTETEKLFKREFKIFGNDYLGVELITRRKIAFNGKTLEDYYLRFDPLIAHHVAENLCIEILSALIDDDLWRVGYLRNDLVQLLEEKFGLKVKVCGNCQYFIFRDSVEEGKGTCRHPEKQHRLLAGYIPSFPCYDYACENWTPKEVPEKHSSA